MTDKLKARARELAFEISPEGHGIDVIEAAILTGMREALREEPDEAMIEAAAHVAAHGGGPGDIWNAANEARARGLE